MSIENLENAVTVRLGDDVAVHETAIVGAVPRDAGFRDVQIGRGSVIRSHTVIYAGVQAGVGLQTGHGAMIRENNTIGDRVSIGTNATLEAGNRIGDGSRIHSGCFLENVTIGKNVFVGPNVVFTDDPHPPCPTCTETVGGAIVGDGAAIGANSTILPGIRIGENALIGAGSVVTKDVEPGTIVAGNPARPMKKLRAELQCRTV
jgi:acetyltransferase-like isoleucine patch superfamily enzyme